WIIVRKFDGAKIGTCGFHRWDFNEAKIEVGYDLKKEFWGNGYMSEALNEIINFAKTKMNLNIINAYIYVDNHKSKQLVSKLGFVVTGTMNEIFRGKEYLHNIYSLNLERSYE
ncbi:MAG: GNAT family N-acetyltransferase, partial [Herbinix sp.]|nr:GNAT family N-acetyltransferase [Herbinix sp.]